MKISNLKTEIKWAIVFIVFTLLWLTMEKLLGYHDEKIAQHPVFTNLIILPAVLIYLFALLDKRKNTYNGIMSYKQGFLTGFKIAVIVSLCIPITQSIISLGITPEYFSNAIDYSVSTGKVTRQEAESYFTLGNYIMQGMIGNLLIGTLTSALLAAFVKKKA